MVPRPKRLARASFGLVSAGKRAISAHFSVSKGPASSTGVAVVVSKKTAKLSTSRHLLKRRVLAVATPWVRFNPGFIIYARSGSPTLTFPELKEEISGLLSQLLSKPETV